MAKLFGAQRMVLKAIQDLPMDAAGYVADSQVARATMIADADLRDWLDTLDGEGLVEVAPTTAGLKVILTSKGRLTLRSDLALSPPECGERHENHFLRDFARQDTTIVVGRFLERFRRFEASGMIGFGDTMALCELRGSLEVLGARSVQISWATPVADQALQSNVIMLGGPDNNELSHRFLNGIEASYRTGDPLSNEIGFRDTLRHLYYAPTTTVGTVGLTDYGLVISHRNPDLVEKRAVFIAGCFGYGTWAAARYIMSEEFLSNPIVAAGESFECLVETQVSQDSPRTMRLIDIRVLK